MSVHDREAERDGVSKRRLLAVPISIAIQARPHSRALAASNERAPRERLQAKHRQLTRVNPRERGEVPGTGDLDGVIDKRRRHEKRATSRQPRIAMVRDCQFHKRVECAIGTGQCGAAAVERHVSDARDEELLADNPLLTDFEQRDDLPL